MSNIIRATIIAALTFLAPLEVHAHDGEPIPVPVETSQAPVVLETTKSGTNTTETIAIAAGLVLAGAAVGALVLRKGKLK